MIKNCFPELRNDSKSASVMSLCNKIYTLRMRQGFTTL